VAIRDGIRSENVTRGCGSKAMEENEESVAPWNSECGPALLSKGMWDVTIATDCAEPRKTSFNAWFNVENRLLQTKDITGGG
jgi:hypothetical protein